MNKHTTAKKQSKTNCKGGSITDTQFKIAKQAVEYITKNLNSNISIKELTEEIAVSDTYLQNSFKAVYGSSVAVYIRTQKMQRAAEQLINTNCSIDSIAEQAGYINQGKFSLAFKKIMGDSPMIYRKKHSDFNK